MSYVSVEYVVYRSKAASHVMDFGLEGEDYKLND